MIKLILTPLFCFLITLFSNGQGNQIEVKITGLENDKGNLMAQLVIQESEELVPVRDIVAEIKNGVSEFVIENVSNGQYGIQYFHDENGNEELDTGWFGIPTEDYGFSLDAKGTFGPPDFSDWKFELSKDITLTMKPG